MIYERAYSCPSYVLDKYSVWTSTNSLGQSNEVHVSVLSIGENVQPTDSILEEVGSHLEAWESVETSSSKDRLPDSVQRLPRRLNLIISLSKKNQ
jgi:hypothetical protein